MKTLIQAAALVLLSVRFYAQPVLKPAAPSIIEVRGSIASVNLTPGGMPSIVVNAAGRQRNVRLGSIRYLLSNDFNPKTGQTVVVRGFEQDGVLFAVTIENRETGQKLALRDEHGLPLWRGGGNKRR